MALGDPIEPSRVDYAHWRRVLAAQGQRRAGSAVRRTAQLEAARTETGPLDQPEAEPIDVAGANDSQGSSELVEDFGTGRADNPAALVHGTLADLPVTPVPIEPGAEDNGQLDEATDSTITGAGAVSTTGVIGNGPHGGEGSMSGDFDFYRLDVSAGLSVTIDTAGSVLDTVVALYDVDGTMLGSNDDARGVFGPSRLVLPVPGAGTYYAMVTGTNIYGPFPHDPHDAGSGNGVGDEGSYDLTLIAGVVDTDYYGLELAKGDVLGATADGATSALTVFRTDGQQLVGADHVDASGVYPPESPLPGGGNTTVAYVAEAAGRYAIRVDGPPGAYDLTIEAYRPGAEQADYGTVQTLFLDFDGARPNTAIWGGPGVRNLSPFSTFVQRWGIPAEQEGELIRLITSDVRRDVDRVSSRGREADTAVNVVSSQEGRNPFGRRNVSRVIVGGTREESGLSTVGVAQFIDPGNYAHEDSAVVLLDLLSEPCAGDGVSLNCYLDPYSDRLSFVARALANVIAHENGHLIGNFHTDNANDRASVMDSGEADFQTLRCRP